VVEGEDGPCVRADLHYYESHPMAARLVEEAERGVGGMGLSHDARAAKERFDPAARRLVIERLASVASVDLVRRPATNRNLWESAPVNDDLPPMDETAAADPAAGTDLKAGLLAALSPMLDEAFESGDAGKAVAALKDFIKLHAKHTGGGGADPVPEADEDAADGKADPDKTEAVKELAALKHKLAVRDLCEQAGVKADKPLLESLEALPLETGRKLVEREKARGAGARPTSGGPGGGGAAVPTGAAFVSSIRD
jgi:hypothetical protein